MLTSNELSVDWSHNQMNAIRGLLLDVDGTLVESNDEHAHAWVQALSEGGRPVRYETLRPLIGMGGDKLLRKVADVSADSPEGKRLDDRRRQIFLQAFVPLLRPCRGAKQLLQLLKSRGLRLVVASSAKTRELEKLLQVCGAEGLIDDQTTSDDVDRSKPDPDIIHVALRKIDLPAHEVMMLGDTPYDIEAASKAGIRTIALRSGGWKDADLAGAAAIYDDPEDLARNFDTSPLVD